MGAAIEGAGLAQARTEHLAHVPGTRRAQIAGPQDSVVRVLTHRGAHLDDAREQVSPAPQRRHHRGDDDAVRGGDLAKSSQRLVRPLERARQGAGREPCGSGKGGPADRRGALPIDMPGRRT